LAGWRSMTVKKSADLMVVTAMSTGRVLVRIFVLNRLASVVPGKEPKPILFFTEGVPAQRIKLFLPRHRLTMLYAEHSRDFGAAGGNAREAMSSNICALSCRPPPLGEPP
jgi:hypothetical protein